MGEDGDTSAIAPLSAPEMPVVMRTGKGEEGKVEHRTAVGEPVSVMAERNDFDEKVSWSCTTDSKSFNYRSHEVFRLTHED